MKRALLALGLVTTLCLTMPTHAQPTNAPLPAAALKLKAEPRRQLKYLLYLPPEYSARKQGERWPLMLFLHGSGERGTNVQRVAIHGPLSLVRQGTNFPFIIVAPLCPGGEKWENKPLLQLLDHVEKKYAVDTNRVYLTGLSMGGFGTWTLGLAAPERFAALAPVCGGISYIDLLSASRERTNALKNLPIWTFHGGQDNEIPLDESKRIVDALKAKGLSNVRLTIYPEARHNSWTETYNNPELYEWLLAQKRNSPAASKK